MEKEDVSTLFSVKEAHGCKRNSSAMPSRKLAAFAACPALCACFLDDGRAPYACQNKKAYENKFSTPLLFFQAYG
ncbi:MAG TPA: hypothetical protein H9880_11515 [Candidatus Anaerobutyricum avicola]|nr:hypothetical protein [Candidatus Anaerobutyricum avicola]